MPEFETYACTFEALEFSENIFAEYEPDKWVFNNYAMKR